MVIEFVENKKRSRCLESMEKQSERKGPYPVTATQYQVLEEVGHGLGATVHRAICLPFNEVVAIKKLDLESRNVNVDDIRREAVTMSLTNHPNLVKSYCSFVVDQSVWIVMPFMAGGSCLHIMKAAFPDGFEEPVIATLLKESLKALEYLHRQGHIHRDVKAGNILLDGDGSVKLGDFGVAASMFDKGDRQRSRITVKGTPCWMAPEVIEKTHGYDFKADIWSFGITALELAHGHAPFSKYPPLKVLLMTLQNAPPRLDNERDKKFSKSFKEMISMCLVKEPTKRPSAERLLRHSFFKQARSSDYILRHVLDGLPPLGERVKHLRMLDAAQIAEKKMPFEEQEEKSKTEYKRGVSNWNFNIEDLKAEAALISGDGGYAEAVKEEDDTPKQQTQKGLDDYLPPKNAEPSARDRELRQRGMSAEDLSRCRERAFSGLLPSDERATSDQGPASGFQGVPRPSSGSKEGSEEKSKGPAQKFPIVQRGRFSVTSNDLDLQDPPQGSTRRRSASSQALQLQAPSVASSLSNVSGSSVSLAALLPHLQNALNHAVMQQLYAEVHGAQVPTQ